MTIDIENLENLSLDEIERVEAQLKVAKQHVAARALVPLHREYREIAERVAGVITQYGLTLAEFGMMEEPELETYLYGLRKRLSEGKPIRRERKTKPAPIKYRHPTHPEWTWTGRGSKPVWVREYLRAGGTLDQLRIDTESAKKPVRKKTPVRA